MHVVYQKSYPLIYLRYKKNIIKGVTKLMKFSHTLFQCICITVSPHAFLHWTDTLAFGALPLSLILSVTVCYI